jgi:lipopolysaccharide biosynthesis protein
MDKILVLYVFHIYNNRVEHFIKNAIFYDENVDFIIISNDKNNKIDVPSYVKTLFRDNIGLDFGGWSESLLTNDLYKNYDKFIFLNSSVMGPFIPSYCKEKWTDIYINGLKDNIKLFGSTINTCWDPLHLSHVQSYIFSMDKITLEYLIQQQIFSVTNYANTFGEAICYKEILMSKKIIENKWNIGSLLEYYKDIDFTFSEKKQEEYNIDFLDDIMFPQYRNKMWNDYQLVFIKGNRCNISNM